MPRRTEVQQNNKWNVPQADSGGPVPERVFRPLIEGSVIRPIYESILCLFPMPHAIQSRDASPNRFRRGWAKNITPRTRRPPTGYLDKDGCLCLTIESNSNAIIIHMGPTELCINSEKISLVVKNTSTDVLTKIWCPDANGW